MAFEIGERVTSSWTGPGTIIGPLVRVKEDESDVLGVPHQMVRLDKPLFGQTEVLRPIAKSLPYVDPPKKLTDVQKALQTDPESLAIFLQVFKKSGRILISAAPDTAELLAAQLSSVSRLTPSEAVDYIRVVTDRTHASKFDIIISDPPIGLADRLRVNFHLNGHRAKKGEVQINSRPLAEWLMKEHDVVPEKASNLEGGGDGTQAQTATAS